MTRKVNAHKPTIKWWERHQYKNAKIAVDTLIPKKLGVIETAVRDMSTDEGGWKRKACLDHNQDVIQVQLDAIQKKLDYIEDMLKRHKDDYHWKKWPELERLAEMDWESYLHGIPSRMLRAFRENSIPSFHLRSLTPKKSTPSMPVDTLVEDPSRLPAAIANPNSKDSAHEGEDMSGWNEDGKGIEFGPFSDEPSHVTTPFNQGTDTFESSESMPDTSRDSSPHFKYQTAVPSLQVEQEDTDFSPGEHQEDFVFPGPVSLERVAIPYHPRAVPREPHFKHSHTARPSVTSSMRPIKTIDAKAAGIRKNRAVPQASRPKHVDPVLFFSTRGVKRKATRLDGASRRKNKAARQSSRSNDHGAVHSIPTRQVEQTKAKTPSVVLGRQDSEELGESDQYFSGQTPQKSSHGHQEMDSSPFEASAQEHDEYLDSPCPSTRNKSYPAREQRQLFRKPANADLDIHGKDEDDSDHPSEATRRPANSILQKNPSDNDLATTVRFINQWRLDFMSRPDVTDWFENWPLRHAFSEKNTDLFLDSVLRGRFAPLPLLMCDAGIPDLDKISLAEAIQQHVIQKSSYMKRKDTNNLKRNIRHLNNPGHDCSHKCHNYWYQLWLHLCSELHPRNTDREQADCHPREGSGPANPFFLCLRHPEEPCLPACCILGNLMQVMYQWMAARGYACFDQIPLTELKGAADLPEAILQAHLTTYFIAVDEPAFDGAESNPYVAAGATHRLGDLIDKATKQTNESDDVPIPATSNSTSAMRTRGRSRPEDVEKHNRTQLLNRNTRAAVAKRLSHKNTPPSNQQEFMKEKAHIMDIQRQCLDHFYESSMGQDVVKSNKEWFAWGSSKLKCTLCQTKWYDATPKSNRRPNGKTDGVFSKSTIKFLDHFFAHIEYDEEIRCEEFLRFIEDVPQLADAHEGFAALIETCTMGSAPEPELIKSFTHQR